jgi:hypothetical protein
MRQNYGRIIVEPDNMIIHSKTILILKARKRIIQFFIYKIRAFYYNQHLITYSPQIINNIHNLQSGCREMTPIDFLLTFHWFVFILFYRISLSRHDLMTDKFNLINQTIKSAIIICWTLYIY